jgi:hypothetical protein
LLWFALPSLFFFAILLMALVAAPLRQEQFKHTAGVFGSWPSLLCRDQHPLCLLKNKIMFCTISGLLESQCQGLMP